MFIYLEKYKLGNVAYKNVRNFSFFELKKMGFCREFH
jgi:hypothetical protein